MRRNTAVRSSCGAHLRRQARAFGAPLRGFGLDCLVRPSKSVDRVVYATVSVTNGCPQTSYVEKLVIASRKRTLAASKENSAEPVFEPSRAFDLGARSAVLQRSTLDSLQASAFEPGLYLFT